jgi:hypothetical protein
MMKTAIILLLVAACSFAYEVQPSKVTFSESAKQKISAASQKIVAELCLKEQPEPEIFQTICMTAAYAALGRPVTYNSNCMDCSNADPICMNTCPQFF